MGELVDQGGGGVRLIELSLPEDEGEGLGFRLTRTLWDPYPWVREVASGGRARAAGLRTGDCLLFVDRTNLLGLPVGRVAGLIRGEGGARTVTLRVWNCGQDPDEDPELLWSGGGGVGGERARRALGGVLRALACSVCAGTAANPLVCRRSHLYCHACWVRLQRCALCREPLPRDTALARNLVAEQVFEAIANEYDIKDRIRRPRETASAYQSPSLSPSASPSAARRGQYQFSMMNRTKKTVQFTEKFGQSYASDPNIHRSSNNVVDNVLSRRLSRSINLFQNNQDINSSDNVHDCQQQTRKSYQNMETQTIGDDDKRESKGSREINKKYSNNCCSSYQRVLSPCSGTPRLRSTCSLADLPDCTAFGCALSKSLSNISVGATRSAAEQTSDSAPLRADTPSNCGALYNTGSPLLVLPVAVPSIYVINCEAHAEDDNL